MTQPEIDLSLCVICGAPALFTDSDPGANPVSYDAEHLPAHLRDRAAAGQMPLKSGATKTALLDEARERDIEGRSSMTKDQLASAIAADVATEAAGEERPTLEQVTEILEQDGDPGPNEMTDAPVVHDHAPEDTRDTPDVEEVEDVEDEPKRNTRRRSRP